MSTLLSAAARRSLNMAPPPRAIFRAPKRVSTAAARTWYSRTVALGEADRFAQEYEGFVRKLASRVRAELDLTCDLDDLVGFGFAGLVEAKSRFDATRGVQFNTFAYYRVRGSILDGVRKMAYMPRHAHRARKAAEAMDAALEELGESRAGQKSTPGADGGTPDLAATVAAIDDVLGKMCASYIIAAVGQDETEKQDNPEVAVSGAQDRVRLREALTKLPEREAAVIRGLYFEDRLLDDIGADLGVSKSWASRIHTRALGLLRAAMGDL